QAGDEDVDEITVRLRDCNIRVRLSPDGRAASSPTAPAFSSAFFSVDFSVVTKDVSARVPLAGAATFGLEILDLLTPEELDKVDLKHLESQARILGSLGGGWSSRARIARAIRAGVGAREVLAGHRLPPSSPSVPAKNRFYIALRTSSRPQGFWTESSRVFFREVSEPDGVVGLIQVRAGGFAIVAPAEDEVWEALAGITGADGEPAAMTTEWTLEMETSRRRPVGGATVFLCDLPWSAVGLFRRTGGVRLLQGRILNFECEGTACRPVLISVGAALAAWIAETEEDNPVQECVTAEEVQPDQDGLAEEAAAPGSLEEEELIGLSTTADPLTRILAGQTLLLKQLMPKQPDALAAALQGGASEPRAAVAFGDTLPARCHPGLLRDYLEKRVGISEFRTLGYMVTFFAHGWAAARTSKNVEMEAFCGRGVMVIEQMILDSGRVQVGWLLGGMPEPFFNTAAGLDFLESRVKAAKDNTRQQTTSEATETPNEQPKPS
ncbi:unnamed protein product, partial [Symbiodinium pilosum]